MHWIPLKQDSYLAVCASDSTYAALHEFDLSILETAPTIIAAQIVEPDLYRHFEQLGINPNIAYNSIEGTYRN